MSPLEQAILKTIIYFDIFDFPLTGQELWNWLYGYQTKCDFSLDEFEKIISDQKSELFKNIEYKNNFYFLKDREEIIKVREIRKTISQEKISKAQKVVSFLKLVPWIKMIALTNQLAYFNAQEEADIDFFIITQEKRIFATRFWSAGSLALIGKRPNLKTHQVKDKICLPFFITHQSLDLEDILLMGEKRHNDPHFAYWFSEFRCLYDEDNYFGKLYQENQWLREYLPNWQARDRENVEAPKDNVVCKNYKKVARKLTLDLDEEIYHWLQLKIMSPKLKELVGQGTDVKISDQMLKLHQNDKREYYRTEFYKRLNKYGLL